MKEQLSDCPFCGGSSFMEVNDLYSTEEWTDILVEAKCSECGASIAERHHLMKNRGDSDWIAKMRVKSRWDNRRKLVVKEVPLINIRPVSKWMPCSKSLPDLCKEVLVTLKTQGGNACYVSSRIEIDGEEIWSGLCGRKPLAWMYLPEPYKGE